MSVENVDERDLVQKAKRGDRLAFNTLIRTHAEGILYYLSKTWGTSDPQKDPEDILQDTLIQAWKNMEKFTEESSEGPSSFRKWLFGVAKNVVRNSRRAAKKGKSPPENPTRGTVNGNSIVEEIEYRELDVIIRNCIGKMSSPHKEVMEFSVDDYSDEDIANLLDRRRDTVRQQRYRGTKMLKGIMNRDSRGRVYYRAIQKEGKGNVE